MNRVLNEETGIHNLVAGTDRDFDNHVRDRRHVPVSLNRPLRLRVGTAAVLLAISITSGGAQRAMAENGTPSDATSADATSADATSADAVPADATTATPEKNAPVLPYGYTPPAEIPPGASSDEEWIVQFGDGGKRDTDNARRDFLAVFLRGDFESPEDRANFDKYVQWRLSQYTLREFLTNNAKQQDTASLRSKWLGDVNRARSAGPVVLAAYLEAIVREAPNLFKYHYIARLNGAWILAELNETEAGSAPAVPYLPAADPLLAFLGQQEQLDGVRVPAVRGLARMIRDGQPSEKLRNDIIAAFVNELENGDPKNDVLPAAVAEELGKLGIVNGSDRTPVVINALTKALADKRRSFRARCEAAAALGRLPLDNTINVPLIAFEIATLAQEMAQAFQNEAALAVKNEKQPNYAAWKRCFVALYFAFKGDTGENIKRGHGLSNKDGLNATIKKSVSGAYGQVLPLVIAVLVEKPFDDKHLNGIVQWLQANVPQNRKVHDSFKEIISGDQSRSNVKLSTFTARKVDAE